MHAWAAIERRHAPADYAPRNTGPHLHHRLPEHGARLGCVSSRAGMRLQGAQQALPRILRALHAALVAGCPTAGRRSGPRSADSRQLRPAVVRAALWGG
jgi:hypothetical protein